MALLSKAFEGDVRRTKLHLRNNRLVYDRYISYTPIFATIVANSAKKRLRLPVQSCYRIIVLRGSKASRTASPIKINKLSNTAVEKNAVIPSQGV